MPKSKKNHNIYSELKCLSVWVEACVMTKSSSYSRSNTSTRANPK